MQIQIIDNVEQDMTSILAPAISVASDVRIAVAYVSNGGLKQIIPSIKTALNAGAYVEFLIGMDSRATDPNAVRHLYDLSLSTNQATLLCFATRTSSAIYHPKMYLLRDSKIATSIIGSSNLTKRGLKTNIEANLVITCDLYAEIV